MKLLKLLKESLGLNEGVYDPSILKVFFLAGGPGSGKSYVSGKVTGGLGFRFVNSDSYFENLLRKTNLGLDIDAYKGTPDYDVAMGLRKQAKGLAQKTGENYLDGRIGIIFDGTGSDYNKIADLRNQCIDLGYDTYMLFVNTSLDVALERNQKRARTVPVEVVEEDWYSVQNNKPKYQSLFGSSNFILVDNDKFNEDVLNKVWKQIMKISKASIKNPIGKKWIEAQLASKKRS